MDEAARRRLAALCAEGCPAMLEDGREPIGNQRLHREMERASAMLVPYPDSGDALSKALWQVRYNLACCADTAPLPDLGAARRWLLLERLLAAAIAEQSAAQAREAALAGEMRAYLVAHDERFGGTAEYLSVDVAYGDLYDWMRGLMAERDEARRAEREVCGRLARACDLLITTTRVLHATGDHESTRWTDCNAWPCNSVGRVVTGKEAAALAATAPDAGVGRALDDLQGGDPDFTGGQDSAAYVREGRGR